MSKCSEQMQWMVKSYGQSQTTIALGRGETVLARAKAEQQLLDAIGELECRIAEQVPPAASVGKITDVADEIELWRLEKNIERCQISIAGFEAEIARLKRICEAARRLKDAGHEHEVVVEDFVYADTPTKVQRLLVRWAEEILWGE